MRIFACCLFGGACLREFLQLVSGLILMVVFCDINSRPHSDKLCISRLFTTHLHRPACCAFPRTRARPSARRLDKGAFCKVEDSDNKTLEVEFTGR